MAFGWLAFVWVHLSVAVAQEYDYDAAGRLVEVRYPGGAHLTYTYDGAGNLLEARTGGTDTGGNDTDTGDPDTGGNDTGGTNTDTDTGGTNTDTDTGGNDTDTGGADTDTGGNDTDTGGNDTDTGSTDTGGGCGCATGAPGWPGGFAVLGALLLIRRRRIALVLALPSVAAATPIPDRPLSAHGQEHGLIVDDLGILSAAGWNFDGQLGTGDFRRRYFYERVGDRTDWRYVDAGAFHSLGLDDTGSLWAWGYGRHGELGDGSTLSWPVPIPVAPTVRFRHVAAGPWHSLAVDEDGRLWSWGLNDEGQLGRPSSDLCALPCGPTATLVVGDDWLDIDGGETHSVGLREPGTLWTWGGDTHGQLGNGAAGPTSVPEQVGSDEDWAMVSSRGRHTLALKTDGTLWGWGDNADGQVLGELADIVDGPTRIGDADDWTWISAGGAHSLALNEGGELWGWGANDGGQLGDGTTTPAPAPKLLASDVSYALAGAIDSLAIIGDVLKLWGTDLGALGLGSDGDDYLAPQDVWEGWADIRDPRATLYLNRGGVLASDFYTDDPELRITLECNDDTYCVDMQISSDPTFPEPAVPYRRLSSFRVAPGVGGRQVFARVRDSAGRWSAPVVRYIALGERPHPGTVVAYDVHVFASEADFYITALAEDGRVGGYTQQDGVVTQRLWTPGGAVVTVAQYDYAGDQNWNDCFFDLFDAPYVQMNYPGPIAIHEDTILRQVIPSVGRPRAQTDTLDVPECAMALSPTGEALVVDFEAPPPDTLDVQRARRAKTTLGGIAVGDVGTTGFDAASDGTVVGAYYLGGGKSTYHAFLDHPVDGFRDLGVLYDHGAPDLCCDPLQGMSVAASINDLGIVVGTSTWQPNVNDAFAKPSGFAWSEGFGMIPLSMTGSGSVDYCEVTDVNYFWQSVGYCRYVSYPTRLTLWQGSVNSRVEARVPTGVKVPGVKDSYNTAHTVQINDAGQIATMVDLYDGASYQGRFAALLTPGFGVLTVELAEVEMDQSGEDGDPVNTATGAFVLRPPPDLSLAGSPTLSFARTYDSGRDDAGAMGRGWRHEHEWSLLFPTTRVARVVTPEGQALAFEFVDGREWVALTPAARRFEFDDYDGWYMLSDPQGPTILWFDADGRVLWRSERDGFLAYTHDAEGRLERIARDDGASLDLTWDGDRVGFVTDGVRAVTYDHAGELLIGWEDALERPVAYTYDAGLLVSETLPSGAVRLVNTWDDGRVVRQHDALGGERTFVYEEGVTVVTDVDGAVARHTHDATGRLLSHAIDGGGETTIGYDAADRRAVVTDALGGETRTDWHLLAQRPSTVEHRDGSVDAIAWVPSFFGTGTGWNAAELTYADGGVETLAHDATGRLVGRIDAEGHAWGYEHDPAGRVSARILPTGGRVEIERDERGRVVTQTGPDGEVRFAWDDLGRLVAYTAADGGAKVPTWDDLDRLVTLTAEDGGTTTLTYTDDGEIASLTLPEGGTLTFGYDVMGRVVSVADTDGDLLLLDRDAAGRIVDTTDREGNAWRFTRDVQGFVTAAEDPAGAVFSSAVDLLGRVTVATDPLGNATAFTYDPAGNPLTIASPMGRVGTFTWDAASRLIASEDPAGNVETTTWDGRGLVVGWSVGPATVVVDRDGLGNVTRVTDGNGEDWTLTWDALGRLLGRTDPLGRTTAYAPDVAGRTEQVTTAETEVTLTRDLAGRVTRALHADGTDLAFSWNLEGRLLETASLTLAYDVEGRVEESNGLRYERDRDGRIVKAVLAEGREVTYGYDGRGLVTSVTDWVGGETTLAWDAAWRLTTITRPNGTVTEQAYDADGRMITLVEKQGSVVLADVALTWDDAGRIASATRTHPVTTEPTQLLRSFPVDAAGQVTTLPHDGDGRRLDHAAAWDDANRLVAVDGATFTYDGAGFAVTRTEGGVTTERVTSHATGLPHVAVLREGGADAVYVVTLPDGTLLHTVDAGTGDRAFHHFDETGSTALVTDEAGAVAEAYRYLPYGEVLGAVGSGTPFLFHGRFGVLSEGEGLYRMGVRVYDATSGRFLSPEPVVGSLHPLEQSPYAFARQNPMSYADPLGEAPTSVAGHSDPAPEIAKPVQWYAWGVEQLSKEEGLRMAKEIAALERVEGFSKVTDPLLAELRGAKDSLAKFSGAADKVGKVGEVYSFAVDTINFKAKVEALVAEGKQTQTTALQVLDAQLAGIREGLARKTITPAEAERLIRQANEAFDLQVQGAAEASRWGIWAEAAHFAKERLKSLAKLPPI